MCFPLVFCINVPVFRVFTPYRFGCGVIIVYPVRVFHNLH